MSSYLIWRIMKNHLNDYIEFSVELMSNMNKMIDISDEATLPKFMSSIFEDKLEFYDQDYRTPKLNLSIDLIFQIINDLALIKNKKGDNFSDVSHKIHLRFLKSNSFYKGLIKLSELKGFLISRGYWSNNRLRI